MQKLLFERKFNKNSWSEIRRLQTEIFYSQLTELSSDENTIYPYKFPTRCHPSGINALDIDQQDFQFLLSGGSDSSIKLWSLNEFEPIITKNYIQDNFQDEPEKQIVKNILNVPRKSGHEFGISSIKWWPQDTGMFISASFDQSVKVWDTNTMEDAYTFQLDSKIYDIDVSRTGQHGAIAVASESSLIRLLDMNSTSTSQTLKGHKGKVLAVRWSPTNPYILASGGVDGELKIWDIRRANSCVCSLDQFNVESSNGDEGQSNITTSPAKKRRRVKDISSVKFKFDDQALKSHNGTINSILFNDMGDLVISSGNDEKIKIWDLKPPLGQNKLINFGPIIKNKYPQRLSPCLSLMSETELQYLWFPNDNGEILVFNIEDGKLVSRLNQQRNYKLSQSSKFVLNNKRVTSIVYSGKSSGVYYSASLDGKITIWGPQLDYHRPNFKPILDGDDSDKEEDLEVDENVLDKIHNEMEARKLLQRNPFI